jgi:hypothetical protein
MIRIVCGIVAVQYENEMLIKSVHMGGRLKRAAHMPARTRAESMALASHYRVWIKINRDERWSGWWNERKSGVAGM